MKKILFFSMLCTMLARVSIAEAETLVVETEGTLQELVQQLDNLTPTSLTIKGRINAADIAYLRTGTGRMARLEELDLRDVVLVPGSESYATIKYSPNDGLMSNGVCYFYIADEDEATRNSESNMLGGSNITEKYYSSCLAGAFAGLTQLKKVVWPASMKRIGVMAFQGCTALETVEMPSGLEVIGSAAFSRCTSLRNLDLGTVQQMGVGAFSGCTQFVGGTDEVVDLHSLKEIPQSAFSDCQSLKQVNFSGELSMIGKNAFYQCKALQALSLPDGLSAIEEYAFQRCESLTFFSLPARLKTIGSYAFNGVPLESLTLPDGLERIGEYAFSSAKLTDITLPASLKQVDCLSFKGTAWDSNLSPAEDGVVYAGTVALRVAASAAWMSPHTFSLREGTTVIADGWATASYYYNGKYYYFYTNLESASLPSSLRRIGTGAFADASLLKDISLPEGLEEIGNGAFRGCTRISQVTIPEGVTILGSDYSNGIFSRCTGIIRVTLLAQKLNLGKYDSNGGAFYGCSGIEQVVIGPKVEAIQKRMFSGCKNLSKLVFQERTADASLYIDDYAFAQADALNEVKFPLGHLTIGAYAFDTNSTLNSLSTLEFLGNVESIGKNAFEGHRELSSLNFHGSVRVIGDKAFEDCSKLTEIILPEGLDSIGTRAFYCYNNKPSEITQLSLPLSVKEIGGAAFAGRDMSGQHLVIAAKEIGNGAFSGCLLTSVELKEGVETIGDGAFAGCSLESLTLPSTIKQLGDYILYLDYSNYDKFQSVTSLIESPFEISKNTFESFYTTTRAYYKPLYVPAGKRDVYKNTAGWNLFNKIEEIGKHIAMTVEGHGKVIYRENELTEGTGTVGVEGGGTAVFTFVPDWDSEVASVTVDGKDVTEDVVDNTYTLENVTEDMEITVTFRYIRAEVTIPMPSRYRTYCYKRDLDFSQVKGLKAYVAAGFDSQSSTIIMARVDNVPAGTGLLLVGDAKEYDVPYTTSTSYVLNLLHGMTESGYVNTSAYRINKLILDTDGTDPVFVPIYNNVYMDAGSAYLEIPAEAYEAGLYSAKRMKILFDDETGIGGVKPNGDAVVDIYSVSGMRLPKTKKGLNLIRYPDGQARKFIAK